MKKIISALFVLILLLFATRTAYGAAVDVEITGSYHTTVTEQGEVPANDYNNAKTKVIVRYTIATKIDPVTNKKVFDLANSSAKFENEFKTSDGKPFVTDSIPITEIKGNPETGAIDSFKVFSAKKWDTSLPAESNGLSGEIDLKVRKGNLKSSYTSGGAKPTITSYTFATDNEKPAAPKNNPGNGKPFSADSRIPGTSSIDYDAVARLLSIHDDTIVGTPESFDPILGAALSFPDFQFTGLTTDGSLAVFWPGSDSPYLMTKGSEVFEQSFIPVFYYDVASNLFYASLIDTTFGGTPSSPFLTGLDRVLNPASPDYDPLTSLFVTIQPDVNFAALTNNFTTSAGTGASDREFLADPLPEPSLLAMLTSAIAGILFVRRRAWRKRSGSSGYTCAQSHRANRS